MRSLLLGLFFHFQAAWLVLATSNGIFNAQIFSEVSPEMHWQFALEHDMRWLERFGLTYYECCEPLDRKIHILRRIPNLRKISISPWFDIDRAIDNIDSDYVISYKPSPAIFAQSDWLPGKIRADLRKVIQKTRGKCHLEIIMKLCALHARTCANGAILGKFFETKIL